MNRHAAIVQERVTLQEQQNVILIAGEIQGHNLLITFLKFKILLCVVGRVGDWKHSIILNSGNLF